MKHAERVALKFAVDKRMRELLGLKAGTGPRAHCAAVAVHSGDRCRYRSMAGSTFCRLHARLRRVAA